MIFMGVNCFALTQDTMLGNPMLVGQGLVMSELPIDIRPKTRHSAEHSALAMASPNFSSDRHFTEFHQGKLT